MTAHMSAMARNTLYANRLLIRACRLLSNDEFQAHRTGFFPSIAATLNHIHAVDLYYIDAVEEGGIGKAVYDQTPDYSTADHLAEAQENSDQRLIAVCDRLTLDDLARTVPTDRADKGTIQERIDHLLLHLFQHQIHHRGQVHAMLSGTSVAPPQLDEFYLEFERHPDAERIGMG